VLRFVICFLLAIVFITGSNAFAEEKKPNVEANFFEQFDNVPQGKKPEEKKPNFESIAYSGFKTIEEFGRIGVYLEGSAGKIGMEKEGLTDYLRLRFKNSFSGMTFKQAENIFKLWLDKEKAKKNGSIIVKIWTVGDDYPIAYHIEIGAGNLTNSWEYKTAMLGYGSKNNVPNSIRESISKLIDELAVAFFKARGEF
jgi:hypothetical protein